jgi:hypothetical protein
MKDDNPMNPLTLKSGMVNRYQYTKESQTFELERNLLEDALNLDKYLINEVVTSIHQIFGGSFLDLLSVIQNEIWVNLHPGCFKRNV